jgi:hypothetical protein
VRHQLFVLHAGGACGFKNVNLPPFSAMTSCGNEPLFKDGKGCGSCYQVIGQTKILWCLPACLDGNGKLEHSFDF